MGGPNDELRRARERIESPNVPGEPLSRQELAELVNAWIYECHDGQVVELDANYIGKLERGIIRWLRHPERRAAFRAVLNVNTDQELGFHRPSRSRRTVLTVDRQHFLRAAIGVTAGTVVGLPLTALATLARHGRFTDDAITRLSTAMTNRGVDRARSQVFDQLGLATLTMTTGDPREAVTVGMRAVESAGTIRSGRITDALRELRQLAAPHANIPEVAELRHRIGTVAAIS